MSGNLIITGRIKDTFKTAKGKFVLPVPIEHRFSGNPLIEQVMVTGIGLVQPLALVCLSENADISNPKLEQNLLETLIDVNNTSDSHEHISHLIIFKDGWPEDGDFFTPTLKLKRHVIDQTYKDQYPKWETSEDKLVWV